MGVTIKDIAKVANVSIATVSRVINDKDEGVSKDTRERIKKIMEDLDYRPSGIARGLVTKKTHTLGLIVPDISNPFFPAIVKGVEDAARDKGYNIILCNSDDNKEKELTSIKILKEKCVDGIVYIGANNTTGMGVKLLNEFGIPFVHIDRSIDIDTNIKCSSVHTDGEIGMYTMAKFLIENGHRNIAYIEGFRDSERLKGFLRALKESNLTLNEKLLYKGDFRLKSGLDGAKYLLDTEEVFTAVVCENDLMAAGVIDYFKSHNIKVPDDISVTGYDDIYISQLLEPKLTTMHQETYDMGKVSIEILLKAMSSNDDIHEKIVFKPKLIIRDSVKRI